MPKIIKDDQIFRAVMQVVAQRGYAGATTRQMAEAASVSEVTLFRKYGTKAELVARAITFLIEQSQFETVARYTGDIQADLLRVLRAYQDTVVLHGGFFFALLSEINRTPELADSFSQPLTLIRSVGQVLARYQAEGVLKPENPLHAVASLLGPLVYLSIIKQPAAGAAVPPLELGKYVSNYLEGRSESSSEDRQSLTGDQQLPHER